MIKDFMILLLRQMTDRQKFNFLIELWYISKEPGNLQEK